MCLCVGVRIYAYAYVMCVCVDTHLKLLTDQTSILIGANTTELLEVLMNMVNNGFLHVLKKKVVSIVCCNKSIL
jgi:endonuclease III